MRRSWRGLHLVTITALGLLTWLLLSRLRKFPKVDRGDLRELWDLVQARNERLKAIKQGVKKGSSAAGLPSRSDVFCFGEDRGSRHCRFRNLCWEAQSQRFFILSHPGSLLMNAPAHPKEFLDLTTLSDHNVYFWGFEQASPNYFADASQFDLRVYDWAANYSVGGTATNKIKVNLVRESVLLTKRFFPINVMHIFHDDILGYYSLQQYWPSIAGEHPRLVVFDAYAPDEKHDEPYHWFGEYRRMAELTAGRGEKEEYVCFADAIVGSSKDLAWYQYGYWSPQGPIANHTASGWRLREIARTIFSRLGAAADWDEAEQRRALLHLASQSGEYYSGHRISIISRLKTRLILDEDELKQSLGEAFGMEVKFIRMEEMTLSEIALALRESAVVFGMHGCLLAMGWFLPPGAILIEGFPYAVPAENYTPYREMAGLPGLQLGYRAWTNLNEEANVPHPEREPRLGGISHLSDAEQAKIKATKTVPTHTCCENPYWMYRIFQDTRVNASQIIKLIREAAQEQVQLFTKI